MEVGPGVLSPNPTSPAPEGAGVAVQVVQNAVATGTYTFQLVQSDNADLSSPDVLNARTVLAADLVLDPMGNKLIFLPFPSGTLTKRWVGVRYVLGGTSPSVIVNAWVTTKETLSEIEMYARGSYAM